MYIHHFVIFIKIKFRPSRAGDDSVFHQSRHQQSSWEMKKLLTATAIFTVVAREEDEKKNIETEWRAVKCANI